MHSLHSTVLPPPVTPILQMSMLKDKITCKQVFSKVLIDDDSFLSFESHCVAVEGLGMTKDMLCALVTVLLL